MTGQYLGGIYKVIREIGSGGMATVYLVENSNIDNRHEALKLFHKQFSDYPDIHFLFINETENLKKLQHENLVPIYSSGKENDQFYFTMKYIEGITLREAINNFGKIDIERIIEFTLQILDALSYAHKHNVIHLDIKPENILIDRNGKPYITDFGVAQIPENSMMINGIIGTPQYMSPEQLMGKKIDFRSDLYSLGCVLYEMMTAQPPFTELDPYFITLQKDIKNISDPIKLNPDIPIKWKNIINKLLSFQPENRYCSADELISFIKQEQYTKKNRVEYKTKLIVSTKTQIYRNNLNIGKDKLTKNTKVENKTSTIKNKFFKTSLFRFLIVPIITIMIGLFTIILILNRPDPLWKSAYESYNYGGSYQYFEAVFNLLDGIKLNPEYPEYYYLLSKIFTESLQDYTQAMSYINKVSEIEGENARNLSEKGRLYRLMGNLEMAEEVLMRAVDLEPEYAPAYNYLGNLYYHSGYHEYALELYQKCIDLKPEKITLANIPIKDEHIGFLSNVNRLKYLDLSFSYVTSEGLSFLNTTKNIEILHMRGLDLKTKGLIHLEKLRKLRVLILNFCDILSYDLRSLSSFKRIKRLEVGWTDIDDEAGKYISDLRSLKTLNISSTEIGDSFTEELYYMRKLKHLYMNATDLSDTGFLNITQNEKIQTLDISGVTLSPEVLDTLTNLPNFNMLVAYPAGFSDQGISSIAQLTNLEYLYMSGENLSSANLNKLSNLTQLKVLFLNSLTFKDQSFVLLNYTTNIKILDLSFTSLENQHIQPLTNYTSLLSANLQNTSINEGGLFAFRNNESLWKLNISGNKISDQSLSNLSELIRLETLLLDRTPISGNALKHLTGLTNLIKLSVANTDIFGSGFSSLSEMKSLINLNISGTFAGDQSLSYLSGLNKLSILDITSTRVSWSGLINFRSEHPECELIY